MQITVSPAQVGNGRTKHFVRTDGFHAKAIGCNRSIDRVLDERTATKMTATCKSCQKAVDALAAEETETAPAAVAGPQIHRFDDSGTAYDATQCSDDIKDGDVLVIASEGIVGVLTNAWPVALTEAHGELHPMTGRYRIREMNDGRYEESADIAEQTANELGLSLLPQHQAPAPAASEAPADAPTPELRHLAGMTAPFFLWGRTNRAGEFVPAQTYRQAADAPARVVETREEGGLCARLADGREVTLYGALLRYWVAPAPVEAPTSEQPAAPAVEDEEREHCMPFMGGKVHEVTDWGDDGPEHVFPLCRTGSMTNQGTRYRKVKLELTCVNYIANRDRRRARLAREAAAEQAAATPAAEPVAEQPAPDAAEAHRQQLMTEVAARTLALTAHATAHGYQPVDSPDGERIAWTLRTGHASSARYHWVSSRGVVSMGVGSEYRWQADEAARLARRTGLDEAPLPEHVARMTAEPTETLEKMAASLDVDTIRVEPDGAGRWVVVRGGDFMGTIHDEGARMRRGRYAAWSPYNERHGYFHDMDAARDAVARCWPLEVAEIAGELGVPLADVLTAAEQLDTEWRAEGRRAILRAERYTGADTRVYLGAADELRRRLGVPFHGPAGHTGRRALCSYADHTAPLREDGTLREHEQTAGQIGPCPGSLKTGRAHRRHATRQYTTALSYDVPPKTWLVSGAKPGDQVVIDGETLTVDNCQAGDEAPSGRVWLILVGMGLPMTYAVGDRLRFTRRVRRQDARCQDCGVYVVVESDTATDGPVKGRLCGVCDGPVPVEYERAAR